MFYLEIKLDKKIQIESDTSDFISNIIDTQNNLGKPKNLDTYENEKLLALGFIYNPSTNRFNIKKSLISNN